MKVVPGTPLVDKSVADSVQCECRPVIKFEWRRQGRSRWFWREVAVAPSASVEFRGKMRRLTPGNQGQGYDQSLVERLLTSRRHPLNTHYVFAIICHENCFVPQRKCLQILNWNLIVKCLSPPTLWLLYWPFKGGIWVSNYHALT